MKILLPTVILTLALIPRPEARAAPDVLEVMVGYVPSAGYSVAGELSRSGPHSMGIFDVGYFTQLTGAFEVGGHVTTLFPLPHPNWGVAFMPTIRYAAGSDEHAFLIGLGLGYQHIWDHRLMQYDSGIAWFPYEAYLLRVEAEVGARFHMGSGVYLRVSVRPWLTIGRVVTLRPDEPSDGVVRGAGLADIMLGMDIAL